MDSEAIANDDFWAMSEQECEAIVEAAAQPAADVAPISAEKEVCVEAEAAVAETVVVTTATEEDDMSAEPVTEAAVVTTATEEETSAKVAAEERAAAETAAESHAAAGGGTDATLDKCENERDSAPFISD